MVQPSEYCSRWFYSMISTKIVTLTTVTFYVLKLIAGFERSTDIITYRFTTCDKSGQYGPTLDDCSRHYERTGSPTAGVLHYPEPTSSRIRGVQYFKVPATDWYTVTASGGRGGRGVCTRWPGLSPIVRIERVFLQKGTVLEVSVGHQGTDACSNNPQSVSLCQSNITTIAEAVSCSSEWQNISNSEELDGGGGGGGGSLVRYLESGEVILLVGGGGGESAQFPEISEIDNNFRQIGKNAREGFNNRFSGTRPNSAGSLTAGRGGGYIFRSDFPSIAIDGKEFIPSQFAEGGSDCFIKAILNRLEYFPDTVGGFGGGGGGCGNGAGGGGYQGGSVFSTDVTEPGEGGGSFFNKTNPELLGYNYGHGFVSFLPETCGCAHECEIDSNRSVFWCTCPSDAVLSPDGYDCHRESDLVLIHNNNTETPSVINDNAFEPLILEPLSLTGTHSVGIVSLEVDFQSSVTIGIPGECGLVLVDSTGSIVGVVVVDSERGPTSSIQRVRWQNNSTLSIDPPVTLLNGSLDFASAYLFSSMGAMCLLGDNITANISILPGNILNGDPISPSNTEFVMFFRALLNNTTPEPPTHPSVTLLPLWVYYAIGAGSFVIISAAVALVILCICLICCKKRKSMKRVVQNVKFRSNDLYNFGAGDDSQIILRVNRAHQPVADLNTYSTVKAFRRKSKLISMSVPVDDSTKSHSMPRPYADLTVPNYGVEVPQGVDFSQYNQTRAKMDDTAWDVPRDTLTYMRELGEGEFGKVLLMSAKNIAGYHGSLPVAVKTLSRSRMKDIDKFMQEVSLMKKFNHTNIICLLGVCPAEEDAAPMMILELMPYGDLQAFLEANRPEPGIIPRISVVEFFQFAHDIANALEFLASNLYIHRDVAARNCLVGNELTVKLADFGMARGVQDKDLYRLAGKAKLPVKWMAPESLLYGEFTPASDVWSYGVLLWEICSYGSPPLKDYTVQDVVQIAGSGILSQYHSKPEDCPKELYKLMQSCFANDASERPTALNICRTLRQYSSHDYRLEEVSTMMEENGREYKPHFVETILENDNDDMKTDITIALSPRSQLELDLSIRDSNLSQVSLV